MRKQHLCVMGLLIACCIAATTPASEEITWKSVATEREVTGRLLLPPDADPAKPAATVVYMKNLAVPRLGKEGDETILADLLSAGHAVVVLDYGRDARAVSPGLNADVLKLRQDAANGHLMSGRKIDLAHLYILAEGYRLRRDVEFARDGARVLAMDVQYPSRPEYPVPALIEFSCDNVNRMGTGSLVFCRDTLLDGGQFAGFAVAMADHPVAPPYKGIDDPMPECIQRAEAAVRKLRMVGGDLGLGGNIGALGFSRGSEFAGFLAVTGHSAGEPAGSSAVQAAMVHGARFDFAAIGPEDPMYARFEKAWGPRDANREKWLSHGVVNYLTKDAAPMYLNTSDAESPEFRKGLTVLAKRLEEVGVEHVYREDKDGRGHRVSTDPATLSEVYRFFHQHLPPPTTRVAQPK
jgi:hypothetical protein